MKIVEDCGCGASIQLESDYTGSFTMQGLADMHKQYTDALEVWRKQHTCYIEEKVDSNAVS